MSRPAARALAAGLAGAIFGVGLAVAQMIDPHKVLNFLDITGRWDASLLFVLGGAVLFSALFFRVVLRRPRPVLDDVFHLPTGRTIDASLVGGSVLFGIGWGLAGYCPGPALATLGTGNADAWWIVPAMLAGAALQRWQAARSKAGPPPQPELKS